MNFSRVKLSQLEEGGALDARGGAGGSIAALAASIKAHGLIEPLTVRRGDDKGSFVVVAGNRRLRALRKVHGKKDVEVPVMVGDWDDQHALELSVAENVVREQMHPVDEYTAYAQLVAQGWDIAQIAKRFGVKEKWVAQRLQLVTLAPSLRDAWRAGKISADQAEALSSVPSHEAQEAVWRESAGNSYYAQPQQLRANLRSRTKAVRSTDPVVEFIGGLDAYKAAGGAVTQDLFAEAVMLTDGALIERMEAQEIEAKCAELVGMGWSFARRKTTDDWSTDLLDPAPWLTPAEAKAVAKGGSEGWKARRAARERMENDPEARKLSGCVVERNGATFDITFLAVEAKPDGDDDDSNREEADDAGYGDADDDSARSEDGVEPKAVEPADKVNHALRETVSEWLTRAVSEAMLVDSHVAVAALGASLDYEIRHYGGASPLRVSTSEWPALVGERTSGEAGAWCKEFWRLVNKTPGALLDELCVTASKLIDLRTVRHDVRGHAYVEGRDELLRAFASELPPRSLSSAIDKHFDREAYFARLTKDEVNAALTEMQVAGKRPAKKDALVQLAVDKAREQGWLPANLRLPGLMALAAKEKADA